MNRGIMKGRRNVTNKPWVYYPFDGIADWYINTSIGADINVTLTTGLFRTNAVFRNLPFGAKIRAAHVRVLWRTSVSGAQACYGFDYDSPVAIGTVPNGNSTGPAVYGGAVANHYTTGDWVVRTGGIDDLQFKFCASWASGTSSLVLRGMGVWVELPD